MSTGTAARRHPEGGVRDAHDRQPRHEDRHQTQAVGDHGTGALGETVPDRHAQQGSGHDRGHVDDCPQPDESARHPETVTRALTDLCKWLPSRTDISYRQGWGSPEGGPVARGALEVVGLRAGASASVDGVHARELLPVDGPAGRPGDEPRGCHPGGGRRAPSARPRPADVGLGWRRVDGTGVGYASSPPRTQSGSRPMPRWPSTRSSSTVGPVARVAHVLRCRRGQAERRSRGHREQRAHPEPRRQPVLRPAADSRRSSSGAW